MFSTAKSPKYAKVQFENLHQSPLDLNLIPSYSDEHKTNEINDIKERVFKVSSEIEPKDFILSMKKTSQKSTDPTTIALGQLKNQEEQKCDSKIPIKLKLIFKQTIRGSSINKIKGDKIIQGCLGHSTIVFKRPIIEGKYYLQFKLLHSMPMDHKNLPKHQAGWRIGLCWPQYPNSWPLGQKNSIGYKINTGQIVSGAKVTQKNDIKGRSGDTFGLLITFSPAYKYQTKKQLWTGSLIEIYKNGQKVSTFDKIYQDYYCPALSLYNYASVEVRVNREDMRYRPVDFTPYSQIFQQQIFYENLRNQAIFNQFFKNK